jgi:hypothetical protein
LFWKFLSGEDADFNYAEVDNNEKLDPAGVDLDLEDKYFDDDGDSISMSEKEGQSKQREQDDELYDY